MRIFITILFVSLTAFMEARINFIDVDDLATWEKMFVLAERQKLDVLVYVDFVSCEECKKLRKETFKDKALAQFIGQNVLALKVSGASEVGTALEKAYDYKNVPTLFYLNIREDLFYKHTGFINATDLLNDIKQAKEFVLNYPKWKQSARTSELSLDQWMNLLEIEEMNGRVNPGNSVVERVSLLLDSSDFGNERVLRFVENLCVDVDGAIFQTLVEHPDWITDTAHFNWNIYQQNVFNYSINKAIVKEDSVLLEDVLYQIGRLTVTSGIPNLKFRGRQLYLAELQKWDQYDTLTKVYLDTLPIDSVDLYEVEAIRLMEFYVDQDKAMNLALDYLRAGLAKKETYQLYYGLCLWLYYNYDYVNAYKAGYRAYKMAEDEEERELIQKLLTAIEDEY